MAAKTGQDQVITRHSSSMKSFSDSTCTSGELYSSKQPAAKVLGYGNGGRNGSISGPKQCSDQIDKLKKAEESLRTVMYLSCWGPN